MQRQGGHISRWTWFSEEDCKKRQTTLGQINDDHDDDGETGKKRRQNLKTLKRNGESDSPIEDNFDKTDDGVR